MQKLTLQIMKGKQTANGIVYNAETVNAVVASTKSKNNLVDDINANSIDIVKTVTAKDFFLDREKTEKAVNELVANQLQGKESPEIMQAVAKHIVKALDGACVFFKDLSRK